MIGAWTGAQRDTHDHFREVGRKAVQPGVRHHDDYHAFDREAWRRVADAGLFRLMVPETLGGTGGSLQDWAAAIQGLAAGSGDLGFCVSAVAHSILVHLVATAGNAHQQSAFLPKLISGEWVGAVANAEPGAGTDVMALQSQARPEGDGYSLTAHKRSITNVGAADLVLVSVRVEGVDPKAAVNLILVETDGAGIRITPYTDLMGLRTSPTGDLTLEGTTVTTACRLGELGDGVRFFRQVFALERLLIGYLYLASLQRSLLRAVQHAETREQFGSPIGRNQYVQDKIVRMRIAGQMLATHLAATLAGYLQGEAVADSLSIIKAYGLEAAIQAAQDLMRLLGGRGLRKQEMAEKDLRDLLSLAILGGTVELQKIVIYNETVRQLAASTVPDSPASPPDVVLDVVANKDLERSAKEALIQLTARAFPQEPTLKGRYYYDSEPDQVVIARKGGTVAGMRMIVRRTVLLGDRDVRVAGTGVAVDPAFQGIGLGRLLTARALQEIDAAGDDLVVAFLFDRTAEGLLQTFGFRRIRAEVSYLDRKSGDLIKEVMPCYMRAMRAPTLIDEIEARGAIHLGVGTW
jgi:isovaleryl-CoA dehydrogenase